MTRQRLFVLSQNLFLIAYPIDMLFRGPINDTSSITLMLIIYFWIVMFAAAVYIDAQSVMKGDVDYLRIISLIVDIMSSVIMFANAYRQSGLKIEGAFQAHPLPSESLYFSIITWTTLGYGDVIPVGPSRIFAASEAIMGYLSMAFLIAALQKFMSGSQVRDALK